MELNAADAPDSPQLNVSLGSRSVLKELNTNDGGAKVGQIINQSALPERVTGPPASGRAVKNKIRHN